MKVSGSKVGGSTGLENAERTQGTRRNEETKAGKGASSILDKDFGSSEKVNLSSRAQDIQKSKEIAMSGKDSIDEAKVERLQALIDAGEYKIDADAIADRLVDEHMDMPT